MNELRKLLQDNLNTDFLSAVLSNPRDKALVNKVKVRRVLHKGTELFQLESFRGNQAFHENLEADAASERLGEYMENLRQLQMETREASYTALVSKKGKVTIKRKAGSRKKAGETEAKAACQSEALSHNRKKHYILEEGTPVPFLVDLGVMTKDGKVVHARFDKFRQINRFLEFIEDILPQLERERELTILDFGCGKSYLTFAMYYYLHELKGYDIRIIGLDLKSDVIRHCNELAEKYGYEKLKFLEGNIADYTGADEVDMVVTLHACDTATDFALEKAVGWNAKVILSVPCCQHELNGQLESQRKQHADTGTEANVKAGQYLQPMMKYGLLRERMAALLTDGLRAQYLEREGYEVQVLEFIDMEHTPKNILLRAVKGKTANVRRSKLADENIRLCEEFFGIRPTLGRLLDQEKQRSGGKEQK